MKNQNHPQVSIVIPNYNHARFLSEAIQSVIHQTYRDIEIIVVDDGSTDNSKQVVESFGELVNYIWQENRGLSAARNTGIRAAQGSFITFLDADDLWKPEFLSSLLPLINKYKIGAAYCGSQFMDNNGRILPQTQSLSPPPEEFRYHLLECNFIHVHAVLLRRECLNDEGLFDEKLTALEDYDMWMRLSRHWHFVGTSDILALTRVRSDSMSADTERMISQEQAVIQKHYPSRAKLSPEAEVEWARWQGNAALRIAIAALRQENNKQAVEQLVNAFSIYQWLINQLRVYYELLMADLPRGKKVSSELKNLHKSERRVAHLLTQVFLQLPERFEKMLPLSFANLWMACSQIAYAQKDFGMARRYIIRGIRTYPNTMIGSQSMRMLLKSIIVPILPVSKHTHK